MRVIECEESKGCKLKHGSWYLSSGKQNQLAAYRNRLLEDVLIQREPSLLSYPTGFLVMLRWCAVQ